ncbi:hypothetical protein LINPERPRIM_LOCUS6711 [Linum perenne]
MLQVRRGVVYGADNENDKPAIDCGKYRYWCLSPKQKDALYSPRCDARQRSGRCQHG